MRWTRVVAEFKFWNRPPFEILVSQVSSCISCFNLKFKMKNDYSTILSSISIMGFHASPLRSGWFLRFPVCQVLSISMLLSSYLSYHSHNMYLDFLLHSAPGMLYLYMFWFVCFLVILVVYMNFDFFVANTGIDLYISLLICTTFDLSVLRVLSGIEFVMLLISIS